MTDFPMLNVALSSPRSNYVIDVSLALASGGLLFALRMAREANVFLGRELWQTLDSLDVMCGPEEREEGDARLWKLARLDAHINQLGLYWAGESRHESLLPEEHDKQFLQRYEMLAQSLDEGNKGQGESWVMQYEHQASVDTLALAGALMPYRPVIFTHSAKSSGLLDYLDKSLAVVEVGDTTVQYAKEYFRRLFFRNGVSDLLWHGLQLTAIHLVAPHALVMPAVEPNKAHFDNEWARWQDVEPVVDGWEGAAAYWYALDDVAA